VLTAHHLVVLVICATSSAIECANRCLCKEAVEAELKAEPKPATPLSWGRPLPDLPEAV
jgi:hypothetical protein